jgi:lysophospholipase L1-like esterase
MKVVIYGDSISEGIGARKNNYCNQLKSLLLEKYPSVEVKNFAHTGTTIIYLRELLENSCNTADAVIIAYGNVDAMLRPNTNHKPNYYKLLPKRYKQNGMLNPRPYYSKKWYKNFFQHCDSLFRCTLNKLLLKLQGKTTWVSEKEFYEVYKQCVQKIRKSVCSKVVLLSTVRVNEHFFPGTNERYEVFNKIIKNIAEEEECSYVDLYNNLIKEEYFYDDKFHPNVLGYEKIANLIINNL